MNCKWISHWGLMSVFLPDVDQESSEAHALTPRKETSLGFALLVLSIEGEFSSPQRHREATGTWGAQLHRLQGHKDGQ